MKKTLHYLTLLSIFAIPIFPLIVADSFFFPFITGKAFYFRILVELAFISWITLAFLDAKYRPKFTPLTIGVTLFAVITLIADLLGVNPVRSIWSNFERMEGWLVVAHLWMFYMTTVHIFGTGEEGRRMWHRWLNVSIVVAGIVAIYGLGQLLGWFPTHQGSRVDASLGNAAYMAVYMLMHTGIVAYLFFVARMKQIANAGFLQWAYPILAIVFGFLVIATATRGTTLGLIGGIMLACALYAVFGKNEPTKFRWIATGVIGLIVVLGVVFWLNRDAEFIQKNPVLNRMASISWTNTSGQARQYIWPMALKGFAERPILGWGQENFNYIFNANYEPKMWTQEQWFDRAHSVFLDWLVASGAVGLLAYLALYVLVLMAIWRSSLKISEKSVLTGLIAGYAVHNIFVFDNLASYVFFFALLGFAGSLSVPVLKAKKQAKEFSLEAVEYIVLPIVIIVLLAGIYFLNVRPIQANTRLIAALTSCSNRNALPDPNLFNKALSVSPIADQEIREQILSCAGGVIGNQYPGPTKQAFYDLALKGIKDQINNAPGDARMYVLGGMFLNNVGQTAEALPILEKANQLTPNKQSVAIQLATVYINMGKSEEALALLKKAYESDPAYDEARSAYIVGLVLAGNDGEAKSIASSTTSLFENERVARAYTSTKQYDKAITMYKKLLSTDQKNIPLRVQLAEVYVTMGQKWSAVEVIQSISKDYPEYKDQVEAMVKQIESAQVK